MIGPESVNEAFECGATGRCLFGQILERAIGNLCPDDVREMVCETVLTAAELGVLVGAVVDEKLEPFKRCMREFIEDPPTLRTSGDGPHNGPPRSS